MYHPSLTMTGQVKPCHPAIGRETHMASTIFASCTAAKHGIQVLAMLMDAWPRGSPQNYKKQRAAEPQKTVSKYEVTRTFVHMFFMDQLRLYRYIDVY